MIKRRQFIAGLGSAAAWPVVARAQQAAMPVIGLLQVGAPSSWDFTGFRQGLKDMGYVEGQNLAIDVRWADSDLDRLSGLAADLVHRQRVAATCFQRNDDGMGTFERSASRRSDRGSTGKASKGFHRRGDKWQAGRPLRAVAAHAFYELGAPECGY
jgi:hypothetical protein